MLRIFLTVTSVAVLALAATACGDDDDADPTVTPTGGLTTTASASPTNAASPSETSGASPSATMTPDDEPFEGGTDPVTEPATGSDTAVLVDVRLGEHETYDRFVVEIEGDALPGYTVEYVDSAAQCGSGQPLDVDGDAILRVRLEPASAHTEGGEATIDETELDGPGERIVTAEQGCDFEGVVEWFLGVDGAERPFRVTELSGPTRLVIDVGDEG